MKRQLHQSGPIEVIVVLKIRIIYFIRSFYPRIKIDILVFGEYPIPT